MATHYNFDEAYSMDSFTDSEWESICNHVGLKFASEEGKDGDKDIENINQISKNDEKTGKMKAKDEEKMDIQSRVETSETDVSELRKDMKSLRKTLKIGRVQLLNWNKDDAEIEETYKEFKNMSKMIKKKFKGLLYKEKSVEVGEKEKDKYIPVDPDVVDDTRKTSTWKPICSTLEGQTRYKCPSCDYIGRSVGKTYAHMVDNHNAKSLECRNCTFSTKNPMSLHNHNKMYCANRDRKQFW